MKDKTDTGSRFYRRCMMALVLAAVAGYLVAYVQADLGDGHYNRYSSAYQQCFYNVLNNGAAPVDCNSVAGVREELAAHRQAYAVGDPALNLAAALTLTILLSPLLRKLAGRISAGRNIEPEQIPVEPRQLPFKYGHLDIDPLVDDAVGDAA
ncbi:MAG: hypothetical protein ABJ308_13220 [Halieaceae bacterium]